MRISPIALFTAIQLLLTAPGFAQEAGTDDSFPMTKEDVNSCLESADRVGFYLACRDSAEKLTSPECRAMREQRFRTPPRLDAKGFRNTNYDYDAEYSEERAAKLIADGGSGKIYRKAMWEAAKSIDKKLLAINLAGWAAEIGSWYFFGTGRVFIGGAVNLSGWGLSAYSSTMVAKDLSRAANEHLLKAYWHVKDCYNGEDGYALDDKQIMQCLEQRLPHQGVVNIYSTLLSSGEGGRLSREQLRAMASEGYSHELPKAQFLVACGMIQNMNDKMSAAENAKLTCDKATGLIDINGKNFRQKMRVEGGQLEEWSLESDEPFVEVTEGILRKKVKKKAYINLFASPLPKKDTTRADLGEALARQATLLAPRLMELKDCGAVKPAVRENTPAGGYEPEDGDENSGTTSR